MFGLPPDVAHAALGIAPVGDCYNRLLQFHYLDAANKVYIWLIQSCRTQVNCSREQCVIPYLDKLVTLDCI